jgi:hypothetical protein
MQTRRGTAAAWTAANPVLADGEWGKESDTGKLKLGNGVNAWASLAYVLPVDTSALAPLASPALTGNPTAPTQATADSTTKVATTAFVHAVGAGGGSSTLAGDTDVVIAGPTDGQVLTYEASSTKWKNKASTGGGGGGVAATVATDTPELHGAKRDGKLITGATYAHTTRIVTCATASFVSGDVGKVIVMRHPGTRATYGTTISSVTDATHVVLTADTPGADLASTFMLYGTDDTAAINAAISAIVTAGQASGANAGRLLLSAGIYVVAGATTKTTTNLGNAQITLPAIRPDLADKFELEISGVSDGSAPGHWYSVVPQLSGSVIFSTLQGVVNDSTWGFPAVIGGPTLVAQNNNGFSSGYGGNANQWSNCHITLTNFRLVTPAIPPATAIDLRCMGTASIDKVGVFIFNTPFETGQTLPTNGTVALYMPSLNNNDLEEIGSYTVYGYAYGIGVSDHVNWKSARFIYCNSAVLIAGPSGSNVYVHGMKCGYTSIEGCNVGIDASVFVPTTPNIPRFPCSIDMINFEVHASYHINDPSNFLTGTMQLSDINVVQPLSINGGKNLTITNLYVPRSTTVSYATAAGIAPGNTAAANKTALAALVGSSGPLANGGTLVCDWVGTVSVDCSASAITPNANSLTIVGVDRTLTVLRLGPESSTANPLVLFSLSGTKTVTFQDICLQGPDLIGASGTNIGVLHNGTSGTIKFQECWVRRFTWGVELNNASSTASIESTGTWHEGYGTVNPSICIGAFAATAYAANMHVWATDCRFWNFGDSSTGGLWHAMYVYTSWNLKVDGCTFFSPAATATGYGIQHYDGGAVTTPAIQSEITNCVFDWTVPQNGIFTNANVGKVTTVIQNCSFGALGAAANGVVAVAGDCLIQGCSFQASATSGPRISNYFTPVAAAVTVEDNWFNGAIAGGTGYIQAADGRWRVRGNHFLGATGGNGFYVYSIGGTAGDELEVTDNEFAGSPSECVHGGGSTLSLKVIRNHFRGAGVAIRAATGPLPRLEVRDNDFSPTGGSIFQIDATPTLMEIKRNYGTPGFKTDAGGTNTQTPGAVTAVNIPHGLGDGSLAITPVKLSVQPNNANARGAPAMSVTATSTNVVLTFASALTVSTSYAWNWIADA